MSEQAWPTLRLQGLLEPAVLRLVPEGPTHGHTFTSHLPDGGLGTVKGDTLQPVPHRLEEPHPRLHPRNGAVMTTTSTGSTRTTTTGELFGPQFTDDDWFVRFRKELQLRGASGRQVGEAVASADEYLRSSGERAADAFGDPVAHASALHPRRVNPLRAGLRQWMPAWLMLVGFLLTVDLPLRLSGAPLHLGWDRVVVVGFWALAGVLVLWASTRRAWQRAGALLLTVVVGQALAQDLRQRHLMPLALPPDWLGWLVLLAVLVALHLVTRDAVRDRTIDPRTGKDRWELPGWTWAALPWAGPAFLVATVGLHVLADHTLAAQ